MTVEGYGPYLALFTGGVLDGREFRVPSLAPDRYAMHGLPYREGWSPAAWDGKPLGSTFDVYVFDGMAADRPGYTFKRTVRP